MSSDLFGVYITFVFRRATYLPQGQECWKVGHSRVLAVSCLFLRHRCCRQKIATQQDWRVRVDGWLLVCACLNIDFESLKHVNVIFQPS